MLRRTAIALCLGFITTFTAQAQSEDEPDKTVLQLADYLDYESVSNPQISPDGREVLYSRTRIDKLKDKRVSSIWLMNADGSRNRELMKGGGAIWSPDGSRIAFVSTDSNDKPQIFVRFMDTEGLVTQVTSFEYGPSSMAWSPDGKWLAFVARVTKKPDWTVTLPARPEGAEWTADPVIIDDFHYRQDRVGYTNAGYDHLFVVPAEGGTPRQLTDGNWNVGQRAIGAIAFPARLSWSPDGSKIAFDGPGKPQEPEFWYESHINVVDIESGDIEQLSAGHGSFGNPVWSPDGKSIAYTGYPGNDRLYDVARIYLRDVSSGETSEFADGMPDSPQDLYWSPDSRRIYFGMDFEGDRNIHSIDKNGRLTKVTEGDHVMSLSSLSNSGVAAVTVSGPQSPPAVALVSNLTRSARVAQLTDVNADILHGKTLGRVEEVWYDSEAETGETARVQGWIVYPPDYKPGETYPLMLSIHGGPNAMYNTGFNFTFQEFAARGYVVLYTNPRGSTGYGSDFANAIEGRYPGPVDYADLMNGVDLLVDRGIADPDRLFVTGCSGGGVLTTWIIGQTDRFKAAAALCPVVNWIGMSGTTDVTGWLYDFFPEPFWENPDPWLEHSTIMHVGKVSTPTLLMTGTEDLRTPLAEAEQFYAALKMRGVPTRLIPMNGEYHGTGSIPSNYLRTNLFIRKWFDEFDPAKQEEQEAGEDE